MKTRVERRELLTELVAMRGIVESRSTIPVLSHLLLTVRDDRLELAATDLDVSLTSWCDAEEGSCEPGATAVQARKFLEIVRALADGPVELATGDSNSLHIDAGSSKFRINGLSAEDFPTLTTVDQDSSSSSFEAPFPDVKRMIGKVIFAVSAEESRFQLNGALLKLKDGKVEMVATDGHRLALIEAEMPGVAEADGVLAPRKALLELMRFDSDETIRFRRGEHHLGFVIGRRELTCRILEGTFPDYEKVISTENDRKATFDRNALSEVVHRVALLTGDRAPMVRLGFEPQSLRVSSSNPDLGEAEESLGCDYEAEKLDIGLNPVYVRDFLSAVDSEQVEFALKDENSQCLGQPVGGPDFRYLCVIMPMRI